jgi:uncharacterized membrane protein
MQKYSKFIVALVTAVIAGLSYLYSDASWLPVVVNFAGALGVYQVRNK